MTANTLSRRPKSKAAAGVPQDEQQEAIQSILAAIDGDHGREVLLGGFAGTGKTHSMGNLVEELGKKRRHGRPLLIGACAPTHAAVAELSRKLRAYAPGVPVAARTAASMLGMRMRSVAHGKSVLVPLPVHKRSKNRRYFRDYDVMLVDECGMLDDAYIDSIRKECKANPRLFVIYAGDPGQLLPISSQADTSTSNGLNFKRIPPIFNACSRQFILRKNRRTHDDSYPILEVAQVFRDYIDEHKTGVVKADEMTAIVQRNQQSEHRSVFMIQGRQKIIEKAIQAVKAGKGQPEFSRILAYRNSVVQDYNFAVHRGLVDFYNPAPDRREDPFWPGEIATANEFFAAWTEQGLQLCLQGDEDYWIDELSDDIEESEDPKEGNAKAGAGMLVSSNIVLVENNTRLDILEVESMLHPVLKIECWLVSFSCVDEEVDPKSRPRLYGFLPKNPAQFEAMKSQAFADYRKARDGEEELSRVGASGKDQTQSERQKQAAKNGLVMQVSRDASFALSKRMWMVSRACAPIWHNYAVTFHKSQGSTIENVFLDWSDALNMLWRDKTGTDYHRALYVGATRASRKLVLCFT